MLEAAHTTRNVLRLENASTAVALVNGAFGVGVTNGLQTHLLRFTGIAQ